MKTKSKANDRLGWFRHYVNRYNRLQLESSAQMALFYFQILLVEDGVELELT